MAFLDREWGGDCEGPAVEVAETDSYCGEMDTGDIALVFFATTFVFLQTPAMGLAQAGLLRRKNSLSTIMQIMTNMAAGTLLWWLFCFSLTFGSSFGGFIGNPFTYAAFIGVPHDTCLEGQSGATNIPGLLFAAFQLSFFVMTPVIISGSWAEKMTFNAYLIFCLIFSIFVYCPQAHWIWNEEGFLFKLGVEDFSGGLVIHTSTGVAGLVVSMFLYKRRKNGKHEPHSIPFFVLGSSLIWVGWYSFNAGSAYAANYVAVRALINTHFSACSGACTFLILAYIRDRKWHLLEMMSGALAGLAGITAGSGFVEPWMAVLIGFLASTASFFTIWLLRVRLGLDDVLDVSSLQGSPGIVGSLMVGVFSDGTGLIHGAGFSQLLYQFAGVVSVIIWTGAWTYAILLTIRHTVGTDISLEVEELGLDLAQLGEKAYDIDLAVVDDIGEDVLAARMLQAAASGDLEHLKYLVQGGADPATLKDYDKRTALHLAVAEGRQLVVRYLLKVHDIDVNAEDKSGLTPLHEAVRHRRGEEITTLLGHGAVVNPEAALEEIMHAVGRHEYEIVQWYYRAKLAFGEMKDYDFRTPLHVSVSEGDIDISRLLLRAGCSLDSCDRWNHTPAYYDSKKILPQIVGDSLLDDTFPDETKIGQGQSTFDYFSNVSDSPDSLVSRHAHELCSAVSLGDYEGVQVMLTKGTDPNAGDYDGRTALHIAAAQGHLEIAKLLVRQPGISIEKQDRNKATPLSEAVLNRHHEIAALLRQRGAVMNGGLIGFRLAAAAAKNDLVTLKALNDSGVDVNKGDYDQRTALHLAAANGNYECARWLLLVGANPIARDRFGNTPLNEAKSFGNPAIQNLLENFDLNEEKRKEKERTMREEKERPLSGILSGTQSLSRLLTRQKTPSPPSSPENSESAPLLQPSERKKGGSIQ